MQKERREKTEQKILKAALSLFVRKGYNGTSIDEITKAAELTKGALYGHFESKAHLLLRLIDEFKTRFLKEMIDYTERENLNAPGKLHRILSFNARLALENQSLCVLPTSLTFELKEHEKFEITLKQLYTEYRIYVSKIIKQGQKEGFFKKDLDPDLTAFAFISLHDGTLHQWFLNQDLLEGKDFVKTFRKIFFDGIQNAPYSDSSHE
jgi:AcrR family transcriptional regulator